MELSRKELELCDAERTNCDVITIFAKDGHLLGTICSNDPAGDWDKIEHGHDPIIEKWEDGAGNTCTLNGWQE